MPWRDIALHLVALIAWPGFAAQLVVGLVAEAVVTWALALRALTLRRAALEVLRGLRPSRRQLSALPPLPAAAAFLAVLASIQVAVPFNPVPAGERSAVLAALALTGAGWLVMAWGWERQRAEPGRMLAFQLCWLIAVLAPAVPSENLRPQALGAIAVASHLPLKFLAALLYLMCLPALLQLLPETAPQGLPGSLRRRPSPEQAGYNALRLLLWLPLCGLFATLLAPPAEDPGGSIRFALAGGLAAAAAALQASHPDALRRLQGAALAPIAGATLLVAALTALLT